MKKLLCIFLFIPFISFSQQVKIDTNRINYLELQQSQILSNLDSHHKQFKSGTFLQIGATLLSVVALSNQNSDDDILAIPLSIVSFIGGLIVLDSNKWFSKRKSEVNITPTMLDTRSVPKWNNNPIKFYSKNTLESVNPSKKENPDFIIYNTIKYRVGDEVSYTFSGSKSAIIEKFIRDKNSKFFYKVEIRLLKNNKIKFTSLEFITPNINKPY